MFVFIHRNDETNPGLVNIFCEYGGAPRLIQVNPQSALLLILYPGPTLGQCEGFGDGIFVHIIFILTFPLLGAS